MGGKSKQSQRVKNNARPSNSSRAAELLGSNVPSFVGFAAHPDLGIIPVAPGLSTAELLPEVFDSSISGDYQLLLKKLGKKDPITKAKALQEFTDRISKSEVDEVKAILPLWPKYYQSLGNDINHKVRELTQSTQAAIANKVGKAMAPYLKQLAPVWISSQFDNYAPVASAATTTFKSSFSSNKVQEVFVFCQNEIMDYIWKNLTFHSASTLSNTKSYSAEDAENKYQRVILCSLRSLALFLEQIDGKSTPEVKEKLSNLIQNQKYWSFSKHKVPNIKAAWFEALYSYLQNAPELAEANRNQVIQITFQNMDSTDPLVSPYVWGCILLIQTVFENWYDSVNFQKVLQPKLNYLLKTGGSTCASIIYPNLLPFLSKFTDKTLSHCSLQDFYNNFVNNFKESLTHNLNSAISKSDASAIVSAFYECLRYVIQAQAPDFKTNDDLKWNFCKSIVNDHVVDVVKWNIVKENITTKYVFTNVSSLIAYWSMNSSNFDLYFHLLETFWAQILKLIVENEELEENVESYVKQFVEFIQTLHNASSSTPGENKVKFSDEVKAVARAQKSRNTTSVLHKDLRQIATKLSKLLLERMSKEKSTTYIVQLKTLADLFEDSEFYAEISNGSSLQSAANNIFDILQGPEQISETTVDILFQILMLLENAERNKYLNKLLKLPNKKIQQWVLHRLLSYPLCVEPEVREILSQDHVTDLILNIAYEVITEKSTDKFNLLHKCFFQIDSGEILINKKTVEGITRIMSKPLVSDSMEEMIDTCGSFIAQIMPVICSNNSTRSLQSDIFIKLFKFSINRTESDYLSEDTLWEVTTCWQDALSSNDITMHDELFLECCEIIDNRVVNSQDITVPDIYNIADMVAKLILCSTENEENEAERYKQIDSMITKLENSPLYLRYFEESKTLCTYFELIKGQRTIDSFNEDHIPELTTAKLLAFFRKQMLNFSVLFKLTFNVKTEKHVALNTEGEDDQENTEDYFDSSENLLKTWSDVIYYNILKGINVVAIGESLKLNSHVINSSIWDIISKLLEKTLFVLKNASDDVAAVIKDKLFQLAISNVEKDISWCRAVPYLNSLNQYGKDGNGFILLYEDSINAALDKNNYLAYVNITHSMLDKLEPKCLPINYQMLEDHVDLVFKETSLRLLLSNHFTGDYSNMSDQRLIAQSLDLITEVSARQQSCSEFLLYRQAIDETEFDKLATVVEFINFLNEVLKHFPTELNLKHWDLVRLSLSSWVLSLSNSVTKFNNPQVAMFIASVFRLHSTLVKFITEEKTKSSTELLTNVIDEWDNLFSKEVNLVLFKSFHYMISNCAKSCLPQLLEEICQYAEQLDYKLILNACDSGFKISIDDVINVALDNLSSELHEIRVICVYIINEVAKYVIPKNMEKLEKQVELVDQTGSSGNEKDEWHFLHKFCKHLEKYELNVKQYVEEFSYKLTELTDLQPIQRSDALPYLFLWNGIIHACSKAPAELRSQYALWITENKYEHIYLNFLFRAMPVEILKNHDSKVMNNDMFKPIPWPQFKGHSTTVERYACYFYMQTLKYLPAVVRKWWNTTHTRQKTFVDKLTTNFVSNLICHDELRAITSKKEKHENMQVTVHTSTREVAAVYSIDEARMELVITLAPNHPLGAVKVETGKQIGGRAQSRNVGMQLTIFLTHQNGSIFDGLSLWKKNLDKKFEGVEECYVCYTVIHQDTCQLPKLSCRTCKKKFHGPCLYKWFTTSSKSTCPICRNVF